MIKGAGTAVEGRQVSEEEGGMAGTLGFCSWRMDAKGDIH
jgi:hypothetical protein